MADVRLLAVGQKMPSWVQDSCAEYLPRFRHQFQLVVEEITASKKTGTDAREEHRKRLFDRLKNHAF